LRAVQATGFIIVGKSPCRFGPLQAVRSVTKLPREPILVVFARYQVRANLQLERAAAMTKNNLTRWIRPRVWGMLVAKLLLSVATPLAGQPNDRIELRPVVEHVVPATGHACL
jgi:hypothetical protein